MSVMSLLDAHLEQIQLCSASIAELSFPPPKIFTNALLQPHHITTLIRDTEVHERALFTVPPTEAQETARSRRTTNFQSGATAASNTLRAPRRNTAVAAALGSDLAERIRRGGGGPVGSAYGFRREENEKSDVDVEVLLEGVEKLCGVYPLPGVTEKVASFRQRYRELAYSVAHYEERVAEQAEELGQMNKPRDFTFDDEDAPEGNGLPARDFALSEEDIRHEEEEIKELERKRRMLEERVNGMEKDITGVLR